MPITTATMTGGDEQRFDPLHASTCAAARRRSRRVSTRSRPVRACGGRGLADSTAAWAARRAAAMKPDLPAGPGAAAGPAPPSAASDAAMRAEACSGGRPVPGSIGWSGGKLGLIGKCAAGGMRRGACWAGCGCGAACGCRLRRQRAWTAVARACCAACCRLVHGCARWLWRGRSAAGCGAAGRSA